MLTIISLGAGVQSTTMALMAAHGEITPMPDCAIFADTGNEPAPVYRHLEWLMSANVLPFPVRIVRREGRESLGEEILKSTRGESMGGSDARPPFYVVKGATYTARNPNRRFGQVRRQCTGDYKIEVIDAELRRLLGLKPKQRWPLKPSVDQWLGISLDEIERAKPSQRPAIIRRHPLLEVGLRRWDCLQWLKRHDYPEPPKSACTFCPYRNNEQWRWLKEHDPAGWQEAIAIDQAVRHGLRDSGLNGELFVHRSRVPLAEADLSTAEDRGQGNLFINECEGMCGV